jgi:predicted alpha-1,6-mannanase (GH76 family)
MINAADLVNDSPNRRGVNDNTRSIWSYNQGVILAGLADLTELTGDPAYLARAQRIADAFIANPWHAAPRGSAQTSAGRPLPDASGVIGGILHEHNECDATGAPARRGGPPGIDSTMFKGIFVRNLARLYVTAPKQHYRQFILANARSALDHIKPGHLFGCNWAAGVDVADFVRQAAGLDLVNAALLVSDGAEGAAP